MSSPATLRRPPRASSEPVPPESDLPEPSELRRDDPLFLTWAEYLDYVDRSEARHLGRQEWVNGRGRWRGGEELGEVRPVQGYDENGEPALASWSHNELVWNLILCLGGQFRGTRFKAVTQAMEVRGTNGRGRFPDLLVAPERRRFEPHPEGRELVLLNPVVMFEVLSRSTEQTDRGEKRDDYASIPTLTDYLIVAQDEVLVEHHTRTADGWAELFHDDVTAAATLAVPAVTLPLAEIYGDVLGG